MTAIPSPRAAGWPSPAAGSGYSPAGAYRWPVRRMERGWRPASRGPPRPRGSFEGARLHERHQRGGRARPDVGPRPLVRDGRGVGTRADRGLGGDDRYPSRARGRGRRERAGPHHPQDGRLGPPTEPVKGHRRRGVAGDHDGLDALTFEVVEALAGEADDLLVTARAVRRPRPVAEIDRALLRKAGPHALEDRQAPDARVEQADRSGIAHRTTDRGRRNGRRSGGPVTVLPHPPWAHGASRTHPPCDPRPRSPGHAGRRARTGCPGCWPRPRGARRWAT